MAAGTAAGNAASRPGAVDPSAKGLAARKRSRERRALASSQGKVRARASHGFMVLASIGWRIEVGRVWRGGQRLVSGGSLAQLPPWRMQKMLTSTSEKRIAHTAGLPISHLA